ncbi:hypothetical protein CSE_00770 [Caldisericum exile AZM16c01]|uniref:Uncharacterized protein n=1 Tax=Caldisericum exile (strain DSM 21853 / NBRC 104410 / AZM16c01) TaxID=511051 RepID=A0A7U6GD25_CALEA|nr:hypothetical protein CSE_00620 [Caldisericum exile AZM16c01]BAL80203.1 hypothetical protein CSE_00770 [Caldisericum exile AZM16c01]
MKDIISGLIFIFRSFLGLLDLGMRLSSLPSDSLKHLLHLNMVALDT